MTDLLVTPVISAELTSSITSESTAMTFENTNIPTPPTEITSAQLEVPPIEVPEIKAGPLEDDKEKTVSKADLRATIEDQDQMIIIAAATLVALQAENVQLKEVNTILKQAMQLLDASKKIPTPEQDQDMNDALNGVGVCDLPVATEAQSW